MTRMMVSRGLCLLLLLSTSALGQEEATQEASCSAEVAKVGSLEAKVANLEKELQQSKDATKKAEGSTKKAEDATKKAEGQAQALELDLSMLTTSAKKAEDAAKKAEDATKKADGAQKSKVSELEGKVSALEKDLTQSKDATKKAETAEKKASEGADAKVANLEQLLQKTKDAASEAEAASAGLPYISTDVLSQAYDAVSHLSLHGVESSKAFYPEWAPKDVSTTVISSATVAFGAVYIASTKAAEVSVLAMSQTSGLFNKTSDAAHDLYKANVEPQFGSQINQGLEMYNMKVAPHIETARALYAQQVHPHVGVVSDAIFTGAATAMEHAKALSPVVTEYASKAFAGSAFAFMDGPLASIKAQTAFITAPLAVEIGGKAFRFPRGYVDMALAGFQVLASMYVVFVLTKLAVRIFWKIGVKLIGKSMYKVIRLKLFIISKILCLKIAIIKFFVRIAWRLFKLAFRTILSAGFGCGLTYGIEMGLEMGAQMKIESEVRMGLAAGLTLLFFGMFSCCCRSKAKKGPKADKKKADVKAAAKPVKSDAKAAAKQTKKK